MSYEMSLALDMSFAHHQGRWRLPGSWAGATFPDLKMYQEVAMMAERGCLDMIFFGDGTGIPSTYGGSIDAAVHWGVGWPRQDMSPFIAALAQNTTGLGFGLTYSSTFMHPFYVARLLNSLDHITSGRIAFNVVTSSRGADAANYGFKELADHDARYRRMEEFIDVCQALWRSVGPEAFVWDQVTGQVADASMVAPIDHVGEFFDVVGPLNTVPSPQGAPVLIQAGGSPRGIDASSKFADVVFGGAWDPAQRINHRTELDAALVRSDRDPKKVGILWDIQVIVARDRSEALARREMLRDVLPRDGAAAFMSHQTGLDLAALPETFTLGDLQAEAKARNASPMAFRDLFAKYDENHEMTRTELIDNGWREATGYDHTVVGTPSEVADYLEESFEATGSRGGFMISHPQSTPGDVVDVVGLLVPELQRRGRFRKSYAGATLRENLGLEAFG